MPARKWRSPQLCILRLWGQTHSYPFYWLIAMALSLSIAGRAEAGIHRAPVIISAKKIAPISQYPIKSYRVFRSGADGEAIPIPFQIDEVDKYGDYVLDQGPQPNVGAGDGLYNNFDELSFMGDDVGPVMHPTRWPGQQQPQAVFEIKISPPMAVKDLNEGAVYVAVYLQKPTALVDRKYVVFNLQNGEILTSRYRYLFDQKNYLVVNRVDMVKPDQNPPAEPLPLINSSTFFAKADLKYFVTLFANHRSVNSRLEAFKSGPVRSIVRVNFLYQFLKLNFEVGMYTEVSFFSNSVILPAIIYNPLDGIKNLNKGSGFYYGFALHESPDRFKFETNMKPLSELSSNQGLWKFIKNKSVVETEYWASLIGEDRLMYILMRPSREMLQDGNTPYYYLANLSAQDLAKRNNDHIKPITESPVNMGLYFDLTRFREGEHFMSFQLFFENHSDYKNIELFKSLDRWIVRSARLL